MLVATDFIGAVNKGPDPRGSRDHGMKLGTCVY